MILDSTKLRKAREKSKLSQHELANLIDVSQTTIWTWEKKDNKVKLDYFLDLSKHLEVDVEELCKDGTIVNIQHNNNNKVSSNSAIGINVNIESYQLQQELINSLKQNVELLKEENNKLKKDLSQDKK